MRRIVTLTTDFGTADTFVGVMKGVILSLAPDAVLVDLTHEIPPQDAMAGALALESAVEYYPRGTLHVAVVDPGVGTDRLPIAISTERATFVGPDNGIFTLALRKTPLRQAVRLSNSTYFRHPVSATFHGRDIFASVAGHLAAGVPFRSLGDPIDRVVELALPEPKWKGEELELRVLWIDRFGNLVTNLDRPTFDRTGLPESVTLHAGGLTVHGICRTFGDVGRGEPVAYFGSGGRLEVAVREGSAQEASGARRGDCVVLTRS